MNIHQSLRQLRRSHRLIGNSKCPKILGTLLKYLLMYLKHVSQPTVIGKAGTHVSGQVNFALQEVAVRSLFVAIMRHLILL